MSIKKFISLIAFVFYMNAFFILNIYASTGNMEESLNVDAVWVDGEILQIDVANINTGEQQKLEVRLKDYTDDSEYVSIQAVDLNGNKSNIVQIKNPYYKPIEKEAISNEVSPNKVSPDVDKIKASTIPFTPEGTGEVMDNAKDDGKEFFTIKTESDNVFYLIIDRQRGNDNVYLLNAVTEADLMALAEKSGSPISAIPTPIPQEEVETTVPTIPQEQAKPTKNNIGVFALMGFAIIAGAIVYYYKIYKSKHEEVEDNDEILESDDYEDEYETEYEDEYKKEDELYSKESKEE